MLPTMTIRDERSSDHPAIRNVVELAFDGMPYADGDEADLVETLRSAGALSVSLVCEVEGKIVGYIAFSPAVALESPSVWYALGPVAVRPDFQGRGIGAALVNAGVERVTERGANGVILTGDPKYYSRFGFIVSPGNAPAGEPAEFFMVKVVSGANISGPISFHSAFGSAA